jgi:hypothetical protein
VTSRIRTYVVGDIHGQMKRVAALLYAAELVSDKGRWLGGNSRLLFVGDFFDRGPYGVEAVDFVMRLQQQAELEGGEVESLLGNHDLLAVGAILFRGTFLANHQRNGGAIADLRRITSDHAKWLTSRPALARIGAYLVVHADTDRYLKYGSTVIQINRRVADILAKPDESNWNELLEDLSDRHRFELTAENGGTRLIAFLATFGARTLIHGHTPISYVTGQSPEEIETAYVYQRGRAVNVDGGLYLGGPGFVYRIDDQTAADPTAHLTHVRRG